MNKEDDKQYIEAGYRLGKYMLDKQSNIEKLLNIRMLASSENVPTTLFGLSDMWLAIEKQRTPTNAPSFVVDSGNSSCPIYGSAQANHAFRFWHDILHITYGLDMTVKDEQQVASIHIAEIARVFGEDSLERKLMEADTFGQTMYESMHAKFPHQQRAFDIAYAKHGAAFALTQWRDW